MLHTRHHVRSVSGGSLTDRTPPGYFLVYIRRRQVATGEKYRSQRRVVIAPVPATSLICELEMHNRYFVVILDVGIVGP
jgi:hypothetical protein